jgi:hypothetical protein
MHSALDVKRLKIIANNSPESKLIFEALKNRDRTRKITDLRQFQYKLVDEGSNITKEDIMQTFQELEQAGVGIIVIGRRGKPTRFKWNYSIKKIGKLGLNSKSITSGSVHKLKQKDVNLAEFKTKLTQELKDAVSSKKMTAYMITEIPLREGFSAKIEIPFDLTIEEAKKIAETIQSVVQLPKLKTVNENQNATDENKTNEIENSTFSKNN